MAKGIYVGALKKYQTSEFASNPMPTSWTASEDLKTGTATNDYGEWTLSEANIPTSVDFYVGKAADGDESSYWTSASLDANETATYFNLILPSGIEINPSSISVRQRYCGNTSNPAVLQGYNGINWIDLGTLSRYSSVTTEKIEISEDQFFTRFRLKLYRYNSSYKKCYIYEFSLDSGIIKYPVSEPISVAHKVK